jgi:endonuclease/exonuclease/phosphatase family metal-dependent hydrolase
MILTWLPVVSRSAGRLVANPATPCDILSTRVVVRVELNVNGRQVQVFGTHLDQAAANRSAQFAQLCDFVGGFAGEKLLGGDFNTKPEETTMWSLLGLPDAWTDVVYSGDTGYTHHSMANTPPGKRIDYWRRAGANLHVAEIGVVQTLRSDHNPVVLDVVVRR